MRESSRTFARALNIWLVLLIGTSSAGVRADREACVTLLGLVQRRAQPTSAWTPGSLATGLRELIRIAREPGRLREDARIFSLSTRAWATPLHEARATEDVLGSKLLFDREALLDLMNQNFGEILMHTHPLELHERQARGLGLKPGGPADDYLHILNSLPSFEDVKLATLLTVRGRFKPGFWIISPRYVLAVTVDPARPHYKDGHAGLFSDLLAQIDLVDQRGRSFDVGDVLRVVNRRWPAVRVRVVAALDR